jgi:DNA polymerase epsilon subunit 3
MSTATKRPAEVALQPVPDEMALPLSSVMRIIKSKLPEGVMVHKDARTAFAKACSIFILYLTSW